MHYTDQCCIIFVSRSFCELQPYPKGRRVLAVVPYAHQPAYLLMNSVLSDQHLINLCAVQSNDMMMAVYLASVMRAVVSLHALIENKEVRMWTDKQTREAKEKENEAPKNGEEGDEKEKDGAAAKEGEAAEADKKA